MGLNNNEDNNFDEKSYVKVNVRLAQFRAQYPNGAIVTAHEIVNGMLVMRAAVYRDINDLHPSGTGHAFLTSFDGEKVGEFTETTAVGRALAMMGYSVEKSIASAEEMKRFEDSKKKKETAKTEEASSTTTSGTESKAKTRTSKFKYSQLESKK